MTDLWNRSLTPDAERNDILLQLDPKYTPTSLTILMEEIQHKEDFLVKFDKIFAKIKERKSLYEKMIQFEQSAKDPKRLFGSSSRLLEEEKFRRTCVPNLLKMEGELRQQIGELERKENTTFSLGDRPFLEELEEEIADRFVNTAIFVMSESPKVRRRESRQKLSFRQ